MSIAGANPPGSIPCCGGVAPETRMSLSKASLRFSQVGGHFDMLMCSVKCIDCEKECQRGDAVWMKPAGKVVTVVCMACARHQLLTV